MTSIAAFVWLFWDFGIYYCSSLSAHCIDLRSNYNSAEQAADKFAAADEFSAVDNYFYYGYLSLADYMTVFDTIVSSGGYEHHSKRVWGIKFGVRQALALVYYMYSVDYNCLYYSCAFSAFVLVPD